MIQTGDPKGDGTGGESIWKGKDKSKDSGTGFENEYSPYLYNLRGALPWPILVQIPMAVNSSLFKTNTFHILKRKIARGGWPEAIAEIYAEEGGTPHLDRRHTVFGQLMDEASYQVLDAIAAVETGAMDKPKEDVVMESIDN